MTVTFIVAFDVVILLLLVLGLRDRYHDLAQLPVGLHIPVSVGNGVQREGAVDNPTFPI
jgi:hypothetical protein